MLFCWLLCVVCGSLFISCTSATDSQSEVTVYPVSDRLIAHKIFPNDMAKNDSISANLASGVEIIVHPGTSYKLSFDIDSTQPAPELQLFRVSSYNSETNRVKFRKVRSLTPVVEGNRYVYSFTCQENQVTVWFTTLNVDGKRYEGRADNVFLTGEGLYSDHMSINLVVVGAMEPTSDGVSIDSLSRLMLSYFREKCYGITIDTLYLRYASEHPTVGSNYPANKPWVAKRSSEDFFASDLAGWPEDGLRYSLTIVLVHSVYETDITGYSRLFSGDFTDETVVIGEHVRRTNGSIELLPSTSIISTAVHEVGHFFGLRHTSATRRDLFQYAVDDNGDSIMVGDLSNIEDGLVDTPFCEYILSYGEYKQASEPKDVGDIVYDTHANYHAKTPIYACPDLQNIMFPVTVSEELDVSFSAQQMELFRSTLMIYPH